jgi:hypothetical protein
MAHLVLLHVNVSLSIGIYLCKNLWNGRLYICHVWALWDENHFQSHLNLDGTTFNIYIYKEYMYRRTENTFFSFLLYYNEFVSLLYCSVLCSDIYYSIYVSTNRRFASTYFYLLYQEYNHFKN